MIRANDSKEVVELSAEEYDNMMKEKAPNAFNDMWQEKNDCKK